MESGLTLTGDMMLVLVVLSATIGLFVSELVRVDIAAILVMVVIGLLGLVPTGELFNGFASNAVISIIAVMILGAGLDRTGVMTVVSAWILKIGGNSVTRIVTLVSATVGVISEHDAERRRNRAVHARHVPGFSQDRDSAVAPADADGFLRDSGWHPHDGRFLTADPAERPDRERQRVAAPGCSHAAKPFTCST